MYGGGDIHYITCSCYRRQPLLATARRRNVFLKALEQVRRELRFCVLGYVVMPEHFHLLMTEPIEGTPSTAMQLVKRRVAEALLPKPKRRDPRQAILWDESDGHFWQRRFYDFNVYTEKKRIEKLRYIHRNPVRRGLIECPEDWRWSSYRFFALREPGWVTVELPPAL